MSTLATLNKLVERGPIARAAEDTIDTAVTRIDPATGEEIELPVVVSYDYVRGCSGSRDVEQAQIEPDEPDDCTITAANISDPELAALFPGFKLEPEEEEKIVDEIIAQANEYCGPDRSDESISNPQFPCPKCGEVTELVNKSKGSSKDPVDYLCTCKACNNKWVCDSKGTVAPQDTELTNGQKFSFALLASSNTRQKLATICS